MGFRDDREANVQRIETLERDLAATKNELEAASLRAAEVDDLRKRVVDVAKERDALKQGVEPMWAAKHQRLALRSAGLIAILLTAGIVATVVVHRERGEQAARLARAEADLASCEYTSEPLRQQRDAARTELGQIDDVHGDELARMQQLLNAARMNETGSTLIVTGHIVERSGSVPEGVQPHCVFVIRELAGDTCAAAVTCGARQVFPFNEPPPEIHCSGPGGSAWRADDSVPLMSANASIRGLVHPLLNYDGASRTLDVRETGAPTFSIRIAVDDAIPFHVR